MTAEVRVVPHTSLLPSVRASGFLSPKYVSSESSDEKRVSELKKLIEEIEEHTP
jgi:hypothetical protein